MLKINGNVKFLKSFFHMKFNDVGTTLKHLEIINGNVKI
jgi:hypothetical protein